MKTRYLGIDLGAERIKIVEVFSEGNGIRRLIFGNSWMVDHQKNVSGALMRLLDDVDWAGVAGAAVTGRNASLLRLSRIPVKAAISEGLSLLYPDLGEASVVSIGSNGFAVVDVHPNGVRRIRENSRCSQGTGNFLRQLVERFNLTLPEADELCEWVTDSAPLSGRCPVILKTDMTHLANKGEERGRILAGLYDAVCENVQTLIKPTASTRHLLLIGGVTCSARIRRRFSEYAARHGLRFLEGDVTRDGFMEAYGAAVVAARQGGEVPDVLNLLAEQERVAFQKLAPLSAWLPRVTRMKSDGAPDAACSTNHGGTGGDPEDPTHSSKSTINTYGDGRVVLGFDMGSTGSKALALEVGSRKILWQGYLNTMGNPIVAAQKLVERFQEEQAQLASMVVKVAVTGSGREIVGSLMAVCYGAERVFILNEIAAHGAGALYYDQQVDTIFEIGGQDAKYIRLDNGRICDAAMNEACSAGTGSFIEEQGRRFDGIDHVTMIGDLAMASPYGISLGQHCSVFMAEVIEQAVALGQPREAILAGLFDSVVQNYLNRVKGTRSVGKRIFCQGMPFLSDALAAAVARQTGCAVVVPPNPGTIGALGIALLAEERWNEAVPADDLLSMERFLCTTVEAKDTLICPSTKGCGGSGNRCRIDRLTAKVAGDRKRFLWGGSCSLYDNGVVAKPLSPAVPDPFKVRERELDRLLAPLITRQGRPTVAFADEFSIKELLPFFVPFFDRLGCNVRVLRHASRDMLKRGIEAASIPFCAPVQLFHGVTAALLEDQPDWIFLPLIRELPRHPDQTAATCPMVQAIAGLMSQVYWRQDRRTRLLMPTLDMGNDNYQSALFRKGCREIAVQLGVEERWEAAWAEAVLVQGAFHKACRQAGQEALDYARANHLIPVVVLGRSYTIYNEVLNSNVPRLLREQGAIPIPVDCYPIQENTPIFEGMYWYQGQLTLRASHQIRRQDGVYSIFCSNYACGPDSFTLQFYSYIMENKPFAIIETDGHSGDAGTKTRVEAFLHCVAEDARELEQQKRSRSRTNFRAVELEKQDFRETKRRQDLLLIPPMGVGARVVAALMRSEGLRAEVLPTPDREALALGRRYTSGKECVPMIITLGSLLQRLEGEEQSDEGFAFLMPSACGPCRFGVYTLLHKVALERAGWKDRVRMVTPMDNNYFSGLSGDFQVRSLFGVVASEMLTAALHDVRPVEKVAGAAQEIYRRYLKELLHMVENPESKGIVRSLKEIPSGMGGVKDLVRRAGEEFASIKDFQKQVPTVSVVGEIYVRLDPFANDGVIEHLERAGVRVRQVQMMEWVEYSNWLSRKRHVDRLTQRGDTMAESFLASILLDEVLDRLHDTMGKPLGWGPRTSVFDAIEAGGRYVSPDLYGEAILTVGTPIHEYEMGEIDGVVSIGPLECIPNKIAESHLLRAEDDCGLPSLTLELNGEPLDPVHIESFVFEVKERLHRQRHQEPRRLTPSLGQVGWKASRVLLTAAMKLLPPYSALSMLPSLPIPMGKRDDRPRPLDRSL